MKKNEIYNYNFLLLTACSANNRYRPKVGQ